MGLLYNYNSFSLRRTNKHPSSGPNLPLNLFFTEFMFFITLLRHSQKHKFSTFSSKIYSWTSLQFIFSPLNFFHRPVFRPVPRTLGNSHRVSNSHLTFSSVIYQSANSIHWEKNRNLISITGDRVNRECYMQVRGRVHNSHLGACFCVARPYMYVTPEGFEHSRHELDPG